MVVVVIVVVVVVVEDNCRKHSRKMSDKSDSTTAERHMNGRTNRSKVVVAVPTVVTAVMNSKFGFP